MLKSPTFPLPSVVIADVGVAENVHDAPVCQAEIEDRWATKNPDMLLPVLKKRDQAGVVMATRLMLNKPDTVLPS